MCDTSSQQSGTIGVFDSGVGGLTVLEHLVTALPEYDFDYFGDVARTPYGGRSRSTIARFTEQGIKFLFDQGATLVIIACNSACAVALRPLQEKYLRRPGVFDKKILGIVIPMAEEAAHFSRTKHIGVLGTKATITSRTCREELLKIEPGLTIESVAAPLLAPIVEEGWASTELARLACEQYLSQFSDPQIDHILLACTHYPFLKGVLQDYVGSGVRLVEQGPSVAKKTVDYLSRHPEIETQLCKQGRLRFFTSDEPELFANIGSQYFQRPIESVSRVFMS